MADSQAFFDYIQNGNTFKGDSITLGAAMLDGETITNALVKVPLKNVEPSRTNSRGHRNRKDKNAADIGRKSF